MKVYLSGPITAIGEAKARIIFEEFEGRLYDLKSQINENIEVVNPMKLEHNHDRSWTSYMREDLSELVKCDAVFLLPGHAKSKGAKIELQVAKSLGLNVITESFFEDALYLPEKNNAEQIFEKKYKAHLPLKDLEVFKKNFRILYEEVIIPSMVEFKNRK